MNRKKQALSLGAALLILVVAGAYIFYLSNDDDSEPSLTVSQAAQIFEQQDIHLTKTSDPDAEMINEVRPVTYLIGGTKSKLHIYQYDSIGKRVTASYIQKEKVGELYFYNPVNSAKNLLLIVELEPMGEENMTAEYWEPIGKVSRTVFEKLNDAKEIIYTGTGTNWSSNTTVKYYEYFYKDQEATLRHESWNQTTSTLQYLGDDIASVGDVYYEYQLGSHGGSGRGLTIQPDGTVGLGSSGGSGSIPRKDDTVTFTITWNDQTETFAAQASGQ